MVMEGRTQTGVAFVGSVRAYEEQRIRRHELTRPDKENDRVRNIATLNAQTGPVLLAYRANRELRELVSAAAGAAPLFRRTLPRCRPRSMRSMRSTLRTDTTARRPRRASPRSAAARTTRATSSFLPSRSRTTRCGFSTTTASSAT
jgi:hypothetical protein